MKKKNGIWNVVIDVYIYVVVLTVNGLYVNGGECTTSNIKKMHITISLIVLWRPTSRLGFPRHIVCDYLFHDPEKFRINARWLSSHLLSSSRRRDAGVARRHRSLPNWQRQKVVAGTAHRRCIQLGRSSSSLVRCCCVRDNLSPQC